MGSEGGRDGTEGTRVLSFSIRRRVPSARPSEVVIAMGLVDEEGERDGMERILSELDGG